MLSLSEFAKSSALNIRVKKLSLKQDGSVEDKVARQTFTSEEDLNAYYRGLVKSFIKNKMVEQDIEVEEAYKILGIV